MTATDELRLMLDERGVDYRTHGTTDRTWFEVGRISWFIYERENGNFTADAVFLTPEQAIDVTLGKEPDDAATSKLHDRMNATLLEYERELGSEKADGAITVPFVVEMHQLLEEAATLGGGYQGFWTHDGTLHIELPKLPESILVCLPDKRDREVRSARVWQYTLGDADATGERQGVEETCKDVAIEGEWFECSECGTVKQLIHPNYCPNCGRRVVE